MDLLDLNPSSHILSQWFFLRLLAFTYFCAFTSESVQNLGLWGKDGILPIRLRVKSIGLTGWRRFLYIPSIFLVDSSDRAITWATRVGQLASVALLFDILSVPMLIILHILWQSFLSTAGAFMSRQSDSLLCELGFFSIFYAMATPPPVLAILAMWIMLFKFMFLAGIAKWVSGDMSWRDGTALSYHYETQPLPNPLSWYAHHWPMWVHKAMSYGTLVIEIVLPAFIFFPAPIRLMVFIAFLALQLGIFTTGNFTFLSVLSSAFAAVLLEDRYLGWLPVSPAADSWMLTSFFVSVVSAVVIIVNIWVLVAILMRDPRRLAPLYPLMRLHLANRYGLFAVMTRSRPEVIIEGSDDGTLWKEYVFRYKACRESERPKQMAPHQPRLDWQMWFAALSSYQEQPWFCNFIVRLLQGSEPVLDLLKHNPFPDKAPRYIRARLYNYRFTTPSMRKKTGKWWIREPRGIYMPPKSLDDPPRPI